MARLPRIFIAHQPQHVILRGNDRKEVFCTDADYQYFLDKLNHACQKYDCQLHAYVLMTNHIHLLISPSMELSLPRCIQMLGRFYVQYFNKTYRHTGTLWEGRYKATLIDSEGYLLTCMRYIELNPVRASMVEHPVDYPWSSYRSNAVGKVNPLITLAEHELYQRLGKNVAERQAAYRLLFKTHISERSLADIREATNKSWVLGSPLFQERIAAQLKRQVTPKPRGGDKKSAQYRNIKESHP